MESEEETTRDYLLDYVERIRSKREVSEGRDWSPPPPPPARESYHANRLEWRPSETIKRPPAISLEELRQALPEALRGYILQEEADHILLAKVAAGGGKTHAGVEVAQWAARQGIQVLWVSARHSAFGDLQRMPHFDPRLWYHWQGMNAKQEDGSTMCRFHNEQRVWMGKGYKAFELCWQTCSYDGHMSVCPYRTQKNHPKPITFAMHQHLALGMAKTDFELVIVDELPLAAFIRERVIPAEGIPLQANGPVEELSRKLAELVGEVGEGETLAGRELFDRIGPILSDVYAQVDLIPDALPVVPRVNHPSEVRSKPYWYIMELLILASEEFDAWRHGWERWAERVSISPSGLHLLDRAEIWEHLPKRMIVLDATAQPALYRLIFGRELEEYNPEIRRRGKVYWITSRLNGSGSLMDGENPSTQAREMVEVAKALTRSHREEGRSVAVICHLAVRLLFEAEFGTEAVEHFYNLRGSNSLEQVDCLIVCGTPAPPQQQIVKIATALNPERIRSFLEADEEGRVQPIWSSEFQEFPVSEEVRVHSMDYGAPRNGMTPFRLVGGYWGEPDLQSIYAQLREDELRQALHRARPNARETEVYVLSSVPTEEPADGIWDDPPIAPEGVNWKRWLFGLEDWLDQKWLAGEDVSSKELAEAAGVSNDWVRKGRWLDAILSMHSDRWRETTRETGKRGPKLRVLEPKSDDPEGESKRLRRILQARRRERERNR